jgi:antitoxin (DNA-binding transcriptional repressor) of toxin-antitoxin stability system
MRTIGIRELKAQLSRALRDVQRGELYLVTDRGRVVAELRPPGNAVAAELSPEQAGRRAMINAGELRVAEGDPVPYPRSPVSLPEGASRELLDWVRGGK